MHYAVSDIHNDNIRFDKLLKAINFGESDHLYILGDLFDRCEYNPDPVGVYFTVLKLKEQCTFIKGNHDVWLSEYIQDFFNTSERKRKMLPKYGDNSFAILASRLTEVDLLNLAAYIDNSPLQIECQTNGTDYLMAHAMTAAPGKDISDEHYLLGEASYDFYKSGISGFISICGHLSSGFMDKLNGSYDDANLYSIWHNQTKNVYMIDCGCGYREGRLGCICLETRQCVYVQ